MDILNQIWQHINPLIDWAVFALVIAMGYLVRSVRPVPKISRTLQIFVFSFIVTSIYAYSMKVPAGKYILSYFLPFGFHTIIIKLIERKIKSIFSKLNDDN